MNDKLPGRRYEIAFWLGMAAVLLALCPLANLFCISQGASWFPMGVEVTQAPGGIIWTWLIAFLVAPACAIGAGVLSVIVRPNWRGGAGVAIAACWFIGIFLLRMFLANAPDR